MNETRLQYAILLVLIVFIIILISLAASVFVRKKRSKRLQRIKIILATSIGSQLKNSEPSYPTKIINILKKELKLNYGFMAIANVLVELQEIILLPQTEKPMAIINKIGLDSKIFNKLKSKNSYKIALAIKYSYELGIIKHCEHFKQYTNHKNVNLRREAQLGLFVFEGWGGFKYLSNITQPMSLWQIIRIMEVLEKHPLPASLVQVKNMLCSKHSDTIILALYCANHFELVTLNNEILPCLDSGNERISKLAVQFKLMLEAKTRPKVIVGGDKEIILKTSTSNGSIYT